MKKNLGFSFFFGVYNLQGSQFMLIRYLIQFY